MKTSEKAINRRDFLKIAIGGTIVTIATVIHTSDIAKTPLPRILPERIPRSIADTATQIPDLWYRTLDRVSIESMPLNKSQIDSLPMPPVDWRRFCKSNPDAFVKTKKYGISLPDTFEKLKINYDNKEGIVRVEATDWYTLIHDEPEETFFSAAKTNIPMELWSRAGLRQAKQARQTNYGTFNPTKEKAGEAWKDLADVHKIWFPEKYLKPGTYFRGPDGRIIEPEHKDISMDLDNLVLALVMPDRTVKKIPYSSIKRVAEKNMAEYIGKKLPCINLNALLRAKGIDPEKNALILHANNYAVSIPPWRQKDLHIIFDKEYERKYGTPIKLTGNPLLLSKAARIGGLYKIEAKPVRT